MRLSRMLVALGALVAAVALTTSAEAVTQSTARPTQGAHMKRLDLSSMPKIKSYLRSIGVNPRTVVIQRGNRNYAGLRCPGKRWTCTTKTRVLQVGSQNIYECTGGTGTGETGGTQTCSGTGVQSGNNNTFRCIEKTTVDPAVQDCTVTQSGPSNYALIDQLADLSGTSEQDATQTANVEQDGSGKNEVHVRQQVRQTTPAAVNQDGHQVAIVDQDASGTAKNFSDVHQYISLRASGPAATQMQDTEPLPGGVTDCAPLGGPTEPNQCANILQSAEPTGGNENHLHQLIDEDAKSNTATNQKQGRFDGGSDGQVHQEIVAPESLTAVAASTAGGGGSNNHADQARRQNVSGPPTSSQEQNDPGRCCGISQQGGSNNREDINQAASQKSDANAAQVLVLIGECNSDPGTCSVTHHASNDDDHAHFSKSCTAGPETPCTFTMTTECESTEAFEGTGSGECGPPVDLALPIGPGIFIGSSLLPGTPLTGFEVTMGLADLTSVVPAP